MMWNTLCTRDAGLAQGRGCFTQVAELRQSLRGMPDLERALGAARNAAAAPPLALPPAILATLQRKC